MSHESHARTVFGYVLMASGLILFAVASLEDEVATGNRDLQQHVTVNVQQREEEKITDGCEWVGTVCLDVNGRKEDAGVKGGRGCDAEVPQGEAGYCVCGGKKKGVVPCSGVAYPREWMSCSEVCSTSSEVVWKPIDGCVKTSPSPTATSDHFSVIPSNTAGYCQCPATPVFSPCGHPLLTCHATCLHPPTPPPFPTFPSHRLQSDYEQSLLSSLEANGLVGPLGAAARAANDPEALDKQHRYIQNTLKEQGFAL